MASKNSVCFSLICFVMLVFSFPSAFGKIDTYYNYDVTDDNGLSVRSRRYVDSVISRLADNFADEPLSSGKFHDKGGNFGSGGVGSRMPRMEMIGNTAERVPSSVAPFLLRTTMATPLMNASTGPTSPSPEPHKDELKKVEEKKPIYDPKKGYEGMKEVAKKMLLPELNAGLSSTEAAPARSASGSQPSSDDGYDVSSGDFPQEVTNNTLEKNNITNKQVDHHTYYNSTFIVDPKIGKEYWIDFEQEKDVIVSEMLSQNHRRATTVKLKFDFPFYGHTVRNMTIATGGFLYTGDYIHSWLAATQYIAPLMANFDTSLSPDAKVKYRDNGTALTVEWEKVQLQDRQDAGEFTFQATLHNNGDIVFVYREIPVLVDTIEDTLHPVKVGLSDAYIIDKTVFFVRRKTIYEYHRVNFKREHIRNWTVIYLSALPTCMDLSDCNSCLTTKINFECSWCESVKRCSTGYDRRRQEWQASQCVGNSITNVNQCGKMQTTLVPSSSSQPPHQHLPQISHPNHSIRHEETYTGHTTGMLGIFLVVALIMGLGMWVFYAYRNPHTPSGQVLIKYRPSQWSLRRGEARYTAASIHM